MSNELHIDHSDALWLPYGGRLPVYTKPTGAPALNAARNKSDRERAIEVTASLNTEPYIRKNFTDKHPGTLLTERIGDIYFVVQMPTGQYSPNGSVMGSMVNMARIPMTRIPGEPIKADSTFDTEVFPAHEQERYWESAMSMLQVFDKIAQERNKAHPGRWKAYIVQNEMAYVTGKIACSRTMCFPHFQVFLLDTWLIDQSQDPYKAGILRLNEEKSKISSEFIQDILNNRFDAKMLTNTMKNHIQNRVYTNTAPPYGYGFTFKKDIKPVELASALATNDKLYKSEVDSYIASLDPRAQKWIKTHLIDPRSYRILGQVVHEPGSPRDNCFEMAFSTEHISNGGPLEKMGILVNRSPDNEARISEEEYEDLCQAAVEPLIAQTLQRRMEFSKRDANVEHHIIHPRSDYDSLYAYGVQAS